MKKLYIICGYDDSCSREPYQAIKNIAEEKGYEVVCKDVDWKKTLSKQMFSVEEDAVIVGFSLGAILAWLIAQKYPCKHIILASMTLFSSFEEGDDKKALIDLLGEEFVEDVVVNLKGANLAQKQTRMYGEQEGENELADVLVKNTEHELTKEYIEEIGKLL